MGRERSVEDLIKDKDLKIKIKIKDKDIKEESKRYIFNSLIFNKGKSVSLVRAKADYLATKLKNPKDINFYLKCAWKLPEDYLDDLLEVALSKEKPINYFAFSAALEMKSH